MSPERPAAGPHRPLPGTPRQAPSSARRTTTIDVVRPDGPAGPAVSIELRGRDRRLDAAGHVVDEVEIELSLTLDPSSGEVTALDGAADARAGLDQLVGDGLRAGFGRRLSAMLGPELDRRALRASLLEDLPGAVLVGGYAPLRAGVLSVEPAVASQFAGHQADICIGWAAGGPMHTLLAEYGHVAVPLGPAAPALDGQSDGRRDGPGDGPGDGQGAWHRSTDLAEGTVRRRRRLDVVHDDAGPQGAGHLRVDSHLRDSYRSLDGDDIEEMVLHEYVVAAEVDGAGRLAAITVDPRVLPWSACPGGATSAARLVGADLSDVAARARTELVGPTTCTHLTSTLRALADVAALR